MKPKKKPATKKKTSVNDAKKAAAVVAQVLVHFGSGLGPTNSQIFATPRSAANFSNLLMKYTIKNYKEIRWEQDTANRDAVCRVANLHGRRARAMAGKRSLTWSIIKKTLKRIQTEQCPGGAGGGLVCGSS
jgi:hypothetical protein